MGNFTDDAQYRQCQNCTEYEAVIVSCSNVSDTVCGCVYPAYAVPMQSNCTWTCIDGYEVKEGSCQPRQPTELIAVAGGSGAVVIIAVLSWALKCCACAVREPATTSAIFHGIKI